MYVYYLSVNIQSNPATIGALFVFLTLLNDPGQAVSLKPYEQNDFVTYRFCKFREEIVNIESFVRICPEFLHSGDYSMHVIYFIKYLQRCVLQMRFLFHLDY